MHDDVQREAGIEDVAAHGAMGVGLVERRLQALQAEGELPAQVDERLRDLERVGLIRAMIYECSGVSALTCSFRITG